MLIYATGGHNRGLMLISVWFTERPRLSLIVYVATGKSFHYCKPWFPHLFNNIRYYF